MEKLEIRKVGRVKQWFCDRIGAVATEEFDEYTDLISDIIGNYDKRFKEIDEWAKRQDGFNRFIGGKVGMKGYNSKDGINMFG